MAVLRMVGIFIVHVSPDSWQTSEALYILLTAVVVPLRLMTTLYLLTSGTLLQVRVTVERSSVSPLPGSSRLGAMVGLRYFARASATLMRGLTFPLRQSLIGLPVVFRIERTEDTLLVEGPRGELGFYVVSDGKPNPKRFHVRAPSFVNITSLAEMCRGAKIADAVTILGSVDIVLGEVDR